MIPWHDRVVIGTTDTPIAEAVLEPSAQQQEIDFLLKTSAEYLTQAPSIQDVTSIFTGVRPLVKNDRSARTASLSRDHSISVSDSGLVTIRGGKWTTVRKMAEDCVDRSIESAGLQARPCRTATIPLHTLVGEPEPNRASSPGKAGMFSSPDASEMAHMVAQNPPWNRSITGLPSMRVIDVIWAARNEMARTVEDVLARRTRYLFLNAAASLQAAADVAEILAAELDRDETWQRQQVGEFSSVAQNYLNTHYS
jgi:glycerol-3-phosphate dehydrogenase